jgi:hypothetical protein
MRKIYGLLFGLAFAGSAFAQPDQWFVAIDPSQVSTLLDTATRAHIDMYRDVTGGPTIDGVVDPIWDSVPSSSLGNFSQYITGYTAVTNGVYSFTSELSDGSGTHRLPTSPADFSGSYKIMYDNDFIYVLYDITDDEINDGTLNTGVNEDWEFQEAPYPDSAAELLQGKPYPPYTGLAPEINKKFCYWGYLGAFKMDFMMEPSGTCNGEFRQKADAVAIQYAQRVQSCMCAWKLKDDGSGYYTEIAFSLKVALADSAGNAFVVPQGPHDSRWIAFEMKVIDEDYKKAEIQASWSTKDDDVWDAMVYGGRLKMQGVSVALPSVTNKEFTFSPNPSKDVIRFNKLAASVKIVSMTGITAKTATNVTELNVSNLASGVYQVMVDGKSVGKLEKQ